MQHFTISKSGFVLLDGRPVGTVFDAAAREALDALLKLPRAQKARPTFNDSDHRYIFDPKLGKRRKRNISLTSIGRLRVNSRALSPHLHGWAGSELGEYMRLMSQRHGSEQAWQAARAAELAKAA